MYSVHLGGWVVMLRKLKLFFIYVIFIVYIY